ncbi:MAG: multicopper oxidase domain-containing protein [Candidatus Levybacteria bacterium]|nr:multicopper oxidase domain-containing protein [Candidatus Levybacteria bacterium]
MQKVLIAVFIAFLFVAGIYLYLNPQDKLSQSKQTGEFSNAVNNYPLAKTPEVVELKNGDSYNLAASIVKKNIKGQEIKMLAYNGSIPGPIIKLSQGAEITVNFKNETDVDSTIHSHGVRVDNKFDGVADVTQKAVKPGESFSYKLKFPDAGIFWYHPHIREDYAQELGMYGNYLVTPTQKDYWAEVDREETLFLDDLLTENGKIAFFDRNIVNNTLMGRFGNVMLINADDKYRLSIKQGERVRFYLTNAANTRVFNASIPNAQMRLVGGDNGKYEREEWIDSVLLGPSERAIVEVWFDKAGKYQIIHKTPDKTYTLGTISVAKSPVTTSYLLTPRVNQDFINSLSFLRPLFTKPVDQKLNITVDMMGMNQGSMMMGGNQSMGMQDDNDGDKIEWEDNMQMMNAMSTNKNIKWKLVDDQTKKKRTWILTGNLEKVKKLRFQFLTIRNPSIQCSTQYIFMARGF